SGLAECFVVERRAAPASDRADHGDAATLRPLSLLRRSATPTPAPTTSPHPEASVSRGARAQRACIAMKFSKFAEQWIESDGTQKSFNKKLGNSSQPGWRDRSTQTK